MEMMDAATSQLQSRIEELRSQLAHVEAQLAAKTTASRQSEVHYRALFDHSHDSVLVVEPIQDRIIDANHNACEMLGYTRDELIGRSISSIHPDDGPELTAFTSRVVERGHGFTDKLTCLTKSGRNLMAEISASVLAECGECTRLLVSVKNVTEHKQVETALHQTSSMFQAVFESAPVAIVIADRMGNMQRANRAFENMLGFSSADVDAGLHFKDFFPRGKTNEQMRHLQEVIRGERDFYRMQKPATRKDGREIWTHASMFMLRDSAGVPQNMICMIEDITEHIHAMEERERLLTEMSRQTAILENTSDFVGMADMDGNMIYVNPAGMAMVGRKGESFEGLTSAALFPESAYRSFTDDIVPSLKRGGGVWQGELMVRRRDGHLIPTTQAIMLVRTQEGEPFAVAAIVRDVTDVKQFERALEEARDRAEAANRSKSAFLASMSHELRTPLNAILGFSQLMSRDRGLTRDQQDNLGIINRSGEHLLALINDVLEMSKIEAGRTTLHETSFGLHQLLSDMEDMFRLRATGKNLTILFERDDNVPEYVYSDEGKLRQILINLISNAIKFTEKGGVTVRVVYQPDGDSRNGAARSPRLCFEVQDTGMGIGQQEMNGLFEAFVQTFSGRTVQEGTGLGLPISREFVRMMNGELTVASEVGVGSTFTFTVSATETDESAVALRRVERRVIGLEQGQPEYRILIVEDRLENRRLLSRLLRPLGFDVREAENGAEALDMWEAFSPHLIWMDMRMPVMDGYEATQRIRATTKGQAATIIAITASAFDEDRTMILSAGCDDFVRKPFRASEVYDKMHKHLGVRFVYDEPVDEANGSSRSTRDDTISVHNLQAIPGNLREQLEQATLEADFEGIFTIIESIRAHDMDIADTLSGMANGFRYDEISNLLQSAVA